MLYNAQQHAREWLAGETCRRTLDYFTQNYGDNARVTRLVDDRELWFLCMNNPDGQRLHVHARQPPLAQERGRQRR